jgi:hypothetical protein
MPTNIHHVTPQAAGNMTRRDLKEMLGDKANAFSILLTDDIVFTSNTIIQASTFIKKELGNCKILFTPMYCRNVDYLNSIYDTLPFGFDNGQIFNISKEDYLSQLKTTKGSLPYKKGLGSE